MCRERSETATNDTDGGAVGGMRAIVQSSKASEIGGAGRARIRYNH